MTIEVNTDTSGTVVIEIGKERIELAVSEARRFATVIAFVAEQARKRNPYREEVDV